MYHLNTIAEGCRLAQTLSDGVGQHVSEKVSVDRISALYSTGRYMLDTVGID